MHPLHEKISVAIISGPVDKTPEDVYYSFVFDEAYRLAQKGVNVHIIRERFEEDTFPYGIAFHGLGRKIDPGALSYTIRNLNVYSPMSLFRKPTSVYWENLYATNVFRVVINNDINLIHAHFAYPEG